MALGVIRLPCLVMKSAGSSEFAMVPRAVNQVLMASVAWLPTGTMRVLFPLPVTVMVPFARSNVLKFRLTNSAKRRPDE